MIAEQQTKKIKRTLQGVVISDKMDKTIVVTVTRKIKHPIYGKYVTRKTKYHVHDEENQAKIGDKVEIAEFRPISRTKSWDLVKVVEEVKI
jgi:small subunit ribosomal protein S17